MEFEGYKLSSEQKASIQAFNAMNNDECLSIDAGAGASKTFTCKAILHFCTKEKKVLVLAYNNIIVSEMKDSFPNSVTVATTHSLARSLTKPYKKERLEATLTTQRVCDMLNLPLFILGLERKQLARMIVKLVSLYCTSNISTIGEYIAQNKEKLDLTTKDELLEQVVHYANRLWKGMTDRQSDLPVTHDVYLKEFVLLLLSGEVRLDFDVVVLDEAQDSAPIVQQLFQFINAKKIAVGDKYQSIYEWRGAVNVMESLMQREQPQTRLTTCYRFGQSIAELANSLIGKYHGENPMFQGNPEKESHIVFQHSFEDRTEHALLLFRTNAALMAALMEKYEQGHLCHILKNAAEQKKLVCQARYLFAGRKVNGGPLSSFLNWEEFEEYATANSSNEFRAFFSTIQQYGFDKMEQVLTQVSRVTIESAKYIFSTAHSCKGVEHDHVILWDDFDQSFDRSEGQAKLQETNLLYVALTRAKVTLDISKCFTLCELTINNKERAVHSVIMNKKQNALNAMLGIK